MDGFKERPGGHHLFWGLPYFETLVQGIHAKRLDDGCFVRKRLAIAMVGTVIIVPISTLVIVALILPEPQHTIIGRRKREAAEVWFVFVFGGGRGKPMVPFSPWAGWQVGLLAGWLAGCLAG